MFSAINQAVEAVTSHLPFSSSNSAPAEIDGVPAFLVKLKDGPTPVNDCLAYLTRSQLPALLNSKLLVSKLIHVKSALEEEWLHEGVVLEVNTPVGVRFVAIDRIFEPPQEEVSAASAHQGNGSKLSASSSTSFSTSSSSGPGSKADGLVTGIQSVFTETVPARDNVHVCLTENEAIAKVTAHPADKVKAKVILFSGDAPLRLLDAILLACLLHLGWAYYHLHTTMCGWFAMMMSHVLQDEFHGTLDTSGPESEVAAGVFLGTQIVQPDGSFLWLGPEEESGEGIDERLKEEMEKAQKALQDAPLPTAGKHKMPVIVHAILKEVYKSAGPASLVKLSKDVENIALENQEASSEVLPPIRKLFRRWLNAATTVIKGLEETAALGTPVHEEKAFSAASFVNSVQNAAISFGGISVANTSVRDADKYQVPAYVLLSSSKEEIAPNPIFSTLDFA